MFKKTVCLAIFVMLLGLIGNSPTICRADWPDNVGLLFGPTGIEPGDPSVGEAPPGKTNWYVDADAPDGGDGSYANPYNSFEQVCGWLNGTSYVVGQIRGGDYLYLKGTFSASNHVEGTNNMDIHIGRSVQAGTASEPTVIKSWLGSSRAVFDGEYLKNDLVWLRSTSGPGGHFVIQNIEVKRANGRGIYVADNLSGAEVISIVIRDGKGDGYIGVGGAILFRLNVGEPHFIIRNSLIYNNDLSPTGVAHNRGAISILSEPSAQTGASIDIYDNEIYNESYGVRHKHSGNIITRVYNNIIHDSGGGAVLRATNGSYIHHNIMYNLGVGVHHIQDNQEADTYQEFYNNTLYNVTMLWNIGLGQPPNNYRRDFNVHDNIYYNNVETSNWVIELGRWSGDVYPIAEWQSYYNSYYYLPSRTTFLFAAPNAYSFTAAGTYLSDSTMYNFDPQFVDAANHDFHLQPTSPAINAASDGYDLGALGTGTVPQPPSKATNPDPCDKDTEISVMTDLSWTPGAAAFSHDVYFSTNFHEVDNAGGDVDGSGQADWNDVKILHAQWLTNPTGLNPSADLNDDNDVNCIDFAIIANDWPDSAAFKGNQLTMTFDPGTLNYETTYYWRIDQINTQGRAIGDLWRFTTRPDTGLDPDLVAWWQLENNAIDSAGPNNGTVYGAVATTGKIDLALSFDEIDDYVTVPDFDYTNASDEFTLSFWFKIDDVAGSTYQYMFSHGNYAATNSLNVYFSETDEGTGGEEVRTQIVLSDSTTWYAVTPGIFADGAWHLYTITVSSLDGAVVYIDENPILTNPALKGASLNPSTDIFIGGRCDLNSARFYGNPSIDDGLIDDVRFYNRVLTAPEVAALAAAGGA